MLSPSLLFLLLVAAPTTAAARRETTYTYPRSRVWTTAVRFFRVDMECPITEKDRDDGYFLFEYPNGKKLHPGSVEILEILEDGVPKVRVIVQVPAMPSYIERMMLDKLERKLRAEHGEPPRPVAPPSEPREPDQAPEAPDEGKPGDEEAPSSGD